MVKQYEQVKKEILKKFVDIDENLIHAEKLFTVFSVLNWIYGQNPDKVTYERYMSYIGKYLYNEIDLYWENGVIKYRITREKHDG